MICIVGRTDGHRQAESDAVLRNELVSTWLLSAVLFLAFKNTDCCGLTVHRCRSVGMCCQSAAAADRITDGVLASRWSVRTMGHFTVLIL